MLRNTSNRFETDDNESGMFREPKTFASANVVPRIFTETEIRNIYERNNTDRDFKMCVICFAIIIIILLLALLGIGGIQLGIINNERFNIGINVKNPLCNLDVNRTLCAIEATFEETTTGILNVSQIIGINITECNNDTECVDDDLCTVDSCILGYCKHNLNGNECKIDGQCRDLFGENGACINCTCIDLCANITCDSTSCSTSICKLGMCVITSVVEQCCTTDDQCSTGDECTVGKCLMNKCAKQLKVNATCALDLDCNIGLGQICFECECIASPSVECLLDTECDDNCTCTLDLCSKLCNCTHKPIFRCCLNDIQCINNDPCMVNETCDTSTGLCSSVIKDEDNDGVPCNVDCDDTDNSIGVAITWCRDADNDGDGNRAIERVSCLQPNGFVRSCRDCDDSDPESSSLQSICNVTHFDNQLEVLPPTSVSVNVSGTEFMYIRGSADDYGRSVALHDRTFVVGEPVASVFNPGLIPQTGVAHVFMKDGQAWPHFCSLIASDAGVANQFGASVAIHGILVVVGAPVPISGGTGFVYVFETVTCTELAKLTASDATIGDRFGESVDLHPNGTIVIGAPGVDNSTVLNTGAVYVFDRTGPSTWIQVQKLIIISSIAGEALGTSVAIDEITIISGAPLAGPGRAATWQFDGTTWLDNQILSPCVVSGDRCGSSVDVEGDRSVVGASRRHLVIIAITIEDSGTTFSFDRINGTWLLGQTIESLSPYRFQNCGTSVRLRNNTLAVGCPEVSSSGSFLRTGLVNVYEISVIDGKTWKFVGRPHRAVELQTSFHQDLYGFAVATWEGIIGVGAPEANSDIRTVRHGNSFITECLFGPSCPV